MATVAEQEELFETDNIPKAVKSAATKYRNALKAKADGLASANAKKDSLMDCMREHDCFAVPVEVDGVRKIIRLTKEDKLTIEAAKTAPAAGDDAE